MGSSIDCIFRHRNKQTIILFLLLFCLSFSHGRLQTEDTEVSKLLDPSMATLSRSDLQKAYEQRIMEREKMAIGSLIGSRPPSCEMKGRGCERCVAIQVPVLSHGFLQRTTSRGRRRNPFSTAYSRRDEFSNYIPITWKCKCRIVLSKP